MDKLAMDAMQARKAGMTYGKWKAMQPAVKVNPKMIPDGWKPCEHCGKLFEAKGVKRFCDVTCRSEAYTKRKMKGEKEG